VEKQTWVHQWLSCNFCNNPRFFGGKPPGNPISVLLWKNLVARIGVLAATLTFYVQHAALE
jgi:hypothetical protein